MSDVSLIGARFPYLPLTLATKGQTISVEALVDTGFDGAVVLPLRLLPSGIVPRLYTRWVLADGSTVQTQACSATVQLGAFEPFDIVIVLLGDEPILGRGVTDRFAVTLDHGRQVIVTP